MTRKKNKKISVGSISPKQQFDWAKPKYNAYAIGHGAHGDTKYNRRKNKAETEFLIREDSE